MSTSPKQRYWAQHIESWQASDLSQQAYCRKHKLNTSQFSYWKLKPQASQKIKAIASPPSLSTSAAFIPVTVSTSPATPSSAPNGISLRLPNGCELRGIGAANIATTVQLVEALI
jgi:hypothetical protein